MENEELKPCLNKVKPTGEQYTLIHKRSILHGITDLLDMTSMIHNETVNGDQCMQYVAKRTDVAYRMGFITAWNTRPSPWIPITPGTEIEEGLYLINDNCRGNPHDVLWYSKSDGWMFPCKTQPYPLADKVTHHMPIPPLPGK